MNMTHAYRVDFLDYVDFDDDMEPLTIGYYSTYDKVVNAIKAHIAKHGGEFTASMYPEKLLVHWIIFHTSIDGMDYEVKRIAIE